MQEDSKEEISNLTFKFTNKEARKHFEEWFMHLGEQYYWDWMEYREQEEKAGNITGVEFKFSKKDATCEVVCGRLNR